MDIVEMMNTYGNTVLTVLGAITLIVLILVLVRVFRLLGQVGKTVSRVDRSLDIVNDYLDECKIPVRAIVNLSMSVEALRAATEKTIRDLYDGMSENFKKFAEFLTKFWENLTAIQEEEQEEKELVTIVEPKENAEGVEGEK